MGSLATKFLTEEEIASSVLDVDNEEDSNDEEECVPKQSQKLSEVKAALDSVIHFLTDSTDGDMQPYYEHVRALRNIVVKTRTVHTTEHGPVLQPINRHQ